MSGLASRALSVVGLLRVRYAGRARDSALIGLSPPLHLLSLLHIPTLAFIWNLSSSPLLLLFCLFKVLGDYCSYHVAAGRSFFRLRAGGVSYVGCKR